MGGGGSAFLLLTAYCEYYYLIYLALFTAIYLIWCYIHRPDQILCGDFVRNFLLMGALAALGFAPILSMLLGTEQSDYLYGGWGATAKLGADALAFVVPPPGSLLCGDIGSLSLRRILGRQCHRRHGLCRICSAGSRALGVCASAHR